MTKYLDDILLMSGLAALVYGVGLLSIPAAWITAGLGLIALGVMAGIGGGHGDA